MIIPSDVIEHVVAKQSNNAFSKLLMLIFISYGPLLLKLHAEVLGDVLLIAGL